MLVTIWSPQISLQVFPQTVCQKLEQFHWLHFFTFLHCASSYVSSNCTPEKRKSHIGCICLTFLHSAFLKVSLNALYEKRHIAFVCLFDTVHIQMFPQITCTKKCKVTLVAFVCFLHCVLKSKIK